MRYKKLKPTKDLERGTKLSAGIDMFIPYDFTPYVLIPGESILIPSGIKVKIPHGYALQANNKSSIATQKKLIVGAELVDEDYQGEIGIHLINVGQSRVQLEPGMKIVQWVLIKVSYDMPEPVENEEELYGNIVTERGSGGFGSTGK